MFDPIALENARKLMPNLTYCQNAYDTAAGCDALVVVTEWNEFKHLDMGAIKGAMKLPVLVDGRNIYDPEEMRALGFHYIGIGRGSEPARAEPSLPPRPAQA